MRSYDYRDVHLPEPRCATCGDTGHVQPRAGHPYETCDCPAGRYWTGSTALDDGERPVAGLALPEPPCGTCNGHGQVPDGPESGQDCPDCAPDPAPARLTGEAPF